MYVKNIFFLSMVPDKLEGQFVCVYIKNISKLCLEFELTTLFQHLDAHCAK